MVICIYFTVSIFMYLLCLALDILRELRNQSYFLMLDHFSTLNIESEKKVNKLHFKQFYTLVSLFTTYSEDKILRLHFSLLFSIL